MLRIGEYNTLRVGREVDFGLYLEADEEEILLPKKYVPEGTKIGSELNVFVHTDSEDRIIATTRRPKAVVGEYAAMAVVDVTDFGAFADIGLEKDLLIPKKEQRMRLKKGEMCVVRVMLDKQTGRIIGTTKFAPFLKKAGHFLKKSQKVDLLVFDASDLGFSVLVDGLYAGMVFRNDVYGTVRIGDRLEGYIRHIRPDGKLDITLKALGKGALETNRAAVLARLEAAGGSLPLNYKSAPEEIERVFSLSRKAFKSVLTDLIAHEVIEIDETGMRKK
jgi:hypothetical protein